MFNIQWHAEIDVPVEVWEKGEQAVIDYLNENLGLTNELVVNREGKYHQEVDVIL